MAKLSIINSDFYRKHKILTNYKKHIDEELVQKAIKRFWSGLYSRTRYQASRRGIYFNLEREQFNFLVENANGRCAVSGIEFDIDLYLNNRKKRPFAPSLDRINSHVGYTAKNCRLVCVIVNLAMNEWGASSFLELVRRTYENRFLTN